MATPPDEQLNLDAAMDHLEEGGRVAPLHWPWDVWLVQNACGEVLVEHADPAFVIPPSPGITDDYDGRWRVVN